MTRTHGRGDVGVTLRAAVVATMAAFVVASPAVSMAGPAPNGDGSQVYDQQESQADAVTYVGTVELDPVKGVAGTEVSVLGAGFDPRTEVDVVWNSVQGAWVLDGDAHEEFMGREFTPTRTPMASSTVGDDGSFEASFEAPQDYGFSHDVTVESDGQLLNKAGFRLEPKLIVTPAAGPVGTPITVRLEGVGWAYLENSWQLTYDNQYTGVLTSVTSGGIAETTIPATGGVGPHRIRIIHGAFTVPYLNGQQSPRPDRQDYVADFEVTPGDAVMPQPASSQALSVQMSTSPVAGSGPTVWTDVTSGPVGTPLAISGQGFEPGAEVDLVWTSVVGNRISGRGWDEKTSSVGEATVAPDGTITYDWAIPNDLGGPHRLLVQRDDASVAETAVTITPSLVSAEVVRGPFGEMVDVHLNGVGWTETANIYNLVYDNAFLGYVCGFNSQGDVTIPMPLTGAPGWHYIDLYPGIYKGEDMGGVQNYRTPQLTFAADHPGERLPAFHLAFEVMPGSGLAVADGQDGGTVE